MFFAIIAVINFFAAGLCFSGVVGMIPNNGNPWDLLFWALLNLACGVLNTLFYVRFRDA